ncbi:MAG: hypothetical protein LV479_03385 [Methylacidiphilales bacterium]|nr:hypothetical protein [Candidatus Methylacidiphilales bacterium]
MEKFQIAKYGLMQVVAVAYGMLASGAVIKLAKKIGGFDDTSLPTGFHYAAFFRDYGFWLFLIILGWTALVAYLTSPFSLWFFEPEKLILSGLIFAILLAIIGTLIPFSGLVALFDYSSSS